MKLLFITLLGGTFLGLAPSQSTTAFICISPSAKKFHYNRPCSGLQKCKHEIRKTTVGEAKKLNYTICLFED